MHSQCKLFGYTYPPTTPHLIPPPAPLNYGPLSNPNRLSNGCVFIGRKESTIDFEHLAQIGKCNNMRILLAVKPIFLYLGLHNSPALYLVGARIRNGTT